MVYETDIPGLANELGENWHPEVAAAYFTDTCSIKSHSVTKSSSKAAVKGPESVAYSNVPVVYKSVNTDSLRDQAGKLRSVREYVLTIPTHEADGTRIDFDIEIHSIDVDARGNEPAKSFRPISVGDIQGVILEIVCEKEN